MNRWLCASTLLTLLAFGASTAVYVNRNEWLPERIPVHWGISGEPDAWTDREGVFWYLWLPPLVMTAVLFLTPALPWLSPRRYEVNAGSKVYAYCMFLIVALFGLLHGVILLAYLRPEFPLPQVLVIAIGLFFVLLGNVLGQIPRNFWLGVRTPWTLASNIVWVKTHRLAAWCFVIGGLALAILASLNAPWWLTAGMLAIPALVPVVYSLWLYKKLDRDGKLEPA